MIFGFQSAPKGIEYETAVAFAEWGLRLVPVGGVDYKNEIDSPGDASTYYAERTADYPPFEKHPPCWPAIVLQCACVLEIEPKGVAPMRELIARHRLPKGVATTRTRGGVWQFWFFLHDGWRVGGNRRLPEGVRLKYRCAPTVEDATTEAPPKFPETFPEELSDIRFPEPPFWLRDLCDIRRRPVDRALQRATRAAFAANKTKQNGAAV